MRHRYTKHELRAIHDYLVEQHAEAEAYIDYARNLYEREPDGMVRMRHQWAVKIADHLEQMRLGVQAAIKDGE